VVVGVWRFWNVERVQGGRTHSGVVVKVEKWRLRPRAQFNKAPLGTHRHVLEVSGIPTNGIGSFLPFLWLQNPLELLCHGKSNLFVPTRENYRYVTACFGHSKLSSICAREEQRKALGHRRALSNKYREFFRAVEQNLSCLWRTVWRFFGLVILDATLSPAGCAEADVKNTVTLFGFQRSRNCRTCLLRHYCSWSKLDFVRRGAKFGN
jgi:hypothetical protein